MPSPTELHTFVGALAILADTPGTHHPSGFVAWWSEVKRQLQLEQILSLQIQTQVTGCGVSFFLK